MNQRHDHNVGCEQVLEHLLAYLAKALDAQTSAEIERHLEACRGCFSRAEFERRLRERVAETGTVSAPESLRARIKALTDRFQQRSNTMVAILGFTREDILVAVQDMYTAVATAPGARFHFPVGLTGCYAVVGLAVAKAHGHGTAANAQGHRSDDELSRLGIRLTRVASLHFQAASFHPRFKEHSMKRLMTLAAMAAAIGAMGAIGSTAALAQSHGDHLMVVPDELKWTDVGSLPPGAKLAVIEGPLNEAKPFTFRLKLPANYQIPAHFHSAIEHVTVISGTFNMGAGDKLDTKATRALTAGSAAIMQPGTRHYAWNADETIVQVHGVGPWTITYVNPADDPRKK